MFGNESLYQKALKGMLLPEEKPKPAFSENLEWDICTKKIRTKLDDVLYAYKLYNALCNNDWVNLKTKDIYRCSWRHAGSVVAQNRRYNECYMDFYCTGDEGKIDEEIEKDLLEIGWKCEKQEPEISESNKADLEESAYLIKQINDSKHRF
tara:strand:- start:4267 stop:4719 length:453 start_codon:yes stop_codon:yes gene_type:complete